jgi:hypothetical protein
VIVPAHRNDRLISRWWRNTPLTRTSFSLSAVSRRTVWTAGGWTTVGGGGEAEQAARGSNIATNALRLGLARPGTRARRFAEEAVPALPHIHHPP